MSERAQENGKFLGCGCLGWMGIPVLLFLFAGVALEPIGHGRGSQYRGQRMQQVHTIGLAMYSYANDNGGAYPDGKSSMEVFQKLLDGHYVTDPTLFYFPFYGKTEPVAEQKLKPENVCFDVTAGLDTHSSDRLPLVFMSGFRMTYAPGAPAVSIGRSLPYEGPPWYEQLLGNGSNEFCPVPGIAVFYVNNVSKFLVAKPDDSGIFSVSTVVGPNFKPDGKTYIQLTPEGPLP